MADAARDAQIIPFPTAPQRLAEPTPGPVDGPTVREAVGDVLRDERHDQDRTLADVAESAAVSLPYLSEVERGRKDVSSDLLTSICDALDVEVADVLERAARRLRGGANGSPRMSLLAA